MDWEREELARWAHETADVSHPIDPLELAERLGFSVMDGGAGCDGVLLEELGLILVDGSQRPERRNFTIGHELGHWIDREHGLPDTEAGANYLASALLLPRAEFEAALRRHGWDLLALKSEFPAASFEAIARRIVALRTARAFVLDRPVENPAAFRWYSVPYGLRPEPCERTAAREAFRSGAPCETDSGCSAFAIFDRSYERVIVLRAM